MKTLFLVVWLAVHQSPFMLSNPPPDLSYKINYAIYDNETKAIEEAKTKGCSSVYKIYGWAGEIYSEAESSLP